MKKTQKLKTISLLLALSVLVMTGCSASITDETPSQLTSKVGVQSEEISSSLEPEENPEKDKVFSENLQDEEETKEPEKDEPEDIPEKTTEEDVEEVQEEETKEPEKDEPVVKEETKKEVKKETKPVVKEETKKEVKKETKPVVKEETKKEVKKETKPVVKEETKKEVKEETKSVEEIAKEVLNGKWGNGEERRNKLEASGYDYYEVQSEVSKLIPSEPEPKPVVKKSSSSSSSSTSSKSHSYSAPNNSITIGGYNLPISNKSTQSRLDARYKEVVNWGSSYIGYKYNNDGQSIYLAVHRDSYGWLFPSNSSFKFKDAGGNTKTYHLSEVKGPFKYKPYVDDLQFNAMQGIAGDAIYVQTCIEGSNGSSTYKIYIYR